MRKLFKSALLGLVVFSLVITISTPVLAETTAAAEIQASELEREKQLTTELKLSIPEKTEDPNSPITFVDPSKKGVDITVDDKTTTKAPSPFVLPNLSIGEHTISFSFKNAEGEPRYLQKTLLIVPKSPLFDQTLKTKIIRPSSVVLQGTALPQANVLLVINSEFTHNINVDASGNWEFIVPEPMQGENNVIAFAIRNGIVSNPSKIFSFEYALQEDSTVVVTTTTDPADKVTQFFNSLLANIENNRQQNPSLFYGVLGIAALLIILMVELVLRRRAKKKQEEKSIASIFSSKQSGSESIIDVIQKDNKTQKGKDDKKENSEPKVKQAFADLKKEMSDTDEDDEEKKLDEKKETKKKGIFSLFNKEKRVKDESKKTTGKKDKDKPKEDSKEVAPPKPEEKEKDEEPPKPKEQKDTKLKIEKEGTRDDKDKEKQKEESEPEEKEAKVEKEKKTKKKKPEETKEEVEISDETEEPEKKVLTKEEFLKQFKKNEEE